MVEAVPEKMERSGVEAVQGGCGPGGGGPGGGGPGGGQNFAFFFFLSRPFFQLLLKLCRFFSWTCVGGLGVLISQNCAKHTSLAEGGRGQGCPGQEGTRLGGPGQVLPA